MEREDIRRGYGRAPRGSRPQNQYAPERTADERDDGEGYRRDYGDDPGSPPRGSFGEREYGQQDERWFGPERAYRARRRSNVASWPQERMGMGSFPGYFSASQWGAGVGIPNAPEYDHVALPQLDDYDYDRSNYGASYGPSYRPSHDYGYGGFASDQGFSGRGPKGYKRTDDRIHEEICERLTRHPGIDASEIEVQVKDGEVTMTGHVHDRRAKHMAEDAVDSVSGVKDIHNKIKVERHSSPWHLGPAEALVEDGDDREEPSRTSRARGSSNKG